MKRILSESPRIFLFPEFLAPAECLYLTLEATPKLERSQVVDNSRPNGAKTEDIRTSRGMFFPESTQDLVIKGIEGRIAQITGIPESYGEALQVLHYGVGGEYKPHYDYFDSNTPGGKSNLVRGGQRVATFLMYLNKPEAGGETIFPLLNISVTPELGMALLFYDCTPDGAVDPKTLHGGAPVKAGEKWIATKWLRQHPFH